MCSLYGEFTFSLWVEGSYSHGLSLGFAFMYQVLSADLYVSILLWSSILGNETKNSSNAFAYLIFWVTAVLAGHDITESHKTSRLNGKMLGSMSVTDYVKNN